MDWPTDERQTQTQHEEDLNFWRWPHLDHVSLGRLTLVEQGGRLTWSTVVDTTRNRRIIPLGGSARVFPETRPADINLREHSTRKRSEQGLQYIRMYFPDADFPGELVRDELIAQDKEFGPFDPFLGNLLELSPLHRTENMYDVLFPMGSLNNELNVSSLVPNTSGNLVFKASGVRSFTFETPILQISSSVLSSHDPPPLSNIALVRTYASVSLITISPSADGPYSKITRNIDVTRSDTGDIPITDSRILGAGPDIVAINRMGHVYKCNVYGAGKSMQIIEGGGTSVGDSQADLMDHFWQLGVTNRNDECFLTSRTSVRHWDFRTNESPTVVFYLDSPGEVVTSYETQGLDHLSRVTTTGHVVWLDDRYRSKPLLSFKHHRSRDMTLRTLTIQLKAGPTSLLTSRKNSLVTVYDVNRGADNLVHCNSTPNCLPWDKPMFTRCTGLAMVASPCGTGMSLFRLTHQGSIHRQDIRVVTSKEVETQPTREDALTYEWDADVQNLDEKAKDFPPFLGPAAARYFTEVDLRAAYERIFALRGHSDDESRDDISAVLNRFPSVWQQAEVPFEGMLTTLDIVTHVTKGSKTPAWTDFFAGRTIDYKQRFRALMSGNLPTQDLASRVPWRYSILETVRRLPYEISNDWPSFHERLKKLELRLDEAKSTASLRREGEAQECVIVDLALSCDAFSLQPIAKPHSTDTKPGAIPEEPPEIHFGYFHPIRKIGANHYKSTGDMSMSLYEERTAVSSPLGVRLLLAEWEVGTDVESYVYHDPYNTTESVGVPAPPRQKQALPTAEEAAQLHRRPPVLQTVVAPKQRPPAVVTAAITQPVWKLSGTQVTQTMENSYSQEIAFNPNSDAFSQELMTSTQVLPGPYGGRPGVGKKKPAKKRIGGF